MFQLIKNLNEVLSGAQRIQFYWLQLFVVLSAFLEIVGISSIAFLIAVISKPELLLNIQEVEAVSSFFWLNFPSSIKDLGVVVLFILFFVMLVSSITTWKLSMFGSHLGAELGARLYSVYLSKDWLFHTKNNSAELTKQIANETQRVTSGVIQPLMRMNAKIAIALFISIGVFVYSPFVAVMATLIFSLSYFLMYQLVRKRLNRNGQSLSKVASERFKLLNEGFGGIRDLLLLGRTKTYTDRFSDATTQFAHYQGVNAGLAQTPRFFIEFIAFGSFIALIIYLVSRSNEDLVSVLPMLTVYAMAGFKLLPALQVIYGSMAQIKGNIPAFESIYLDLKSHDNTQGLRKGYSTNGHLGEVLTLEHITFKYPEKSNNAVEGISFELRKNEVIGLVGHSGSGKSTLVDIILGLIKADEGELYIDGVKLTEKNLSSWQSKIGYVPQTIFLSEASLAENIAFGIPTDQICMERVQKAIKLSHLENVVSMLPDGLDSIVGERGVKLSGGQRQRVGIARALYNESEILIFDEATSALDGVTEKLIVDAISEFRDEKTIIMIAHRLKTVQDCNRIFLLNNGKLVDSGSYEQLIDRNPEFRRLSELA